MSPVVTSAGIGRPTAEVFAHATDPTRFSEWQKGVVTGTWTARPTEPRPWARSA